MRELRKAGLHYGANQFAAGGNGFTAGSGSFTSFSIACWRRPMALLPRATVEVPPARPCPQAQGPRARGQQPGACCWWADQAVGRRRSAQSCSGQTHPRGPTGACTGKAWPSTSAERMTQTPSASAALSGDWWPSCVAVVWCQATRRKCGTPPYRAPCSPASVKGTPQRLLRGTFRGLLPFFIF